MDDEFKAGTIAYVNMVREPVDRYASAWYFALFGERVTPQGKAHQLELSRLGIKKENLR